MAKKQLTEEEKREKKLQKLAVIYGQVDDELHIAGKPINEQIHILVDKCNALQTEICQMSDSIKIDDLTKVQDITDIDKKTYLDFVNICALKSNDKLKEKAIAKFESDFENRLFISNLRHSFLESYMSGYDLKITDEDNQEYKPYSDYKSEEFERIMALIKGKYPLFYSSSAVGNMEFSALDCSKGTALAWLCDHLSVDPSQVVAFGDGENDKEMLRFAGIGVAMGNGNEICKAAADVVIGNCADDAVAYFLEELLGY